MSNIPASSNHRARLRAAVECLVIVFMMAVGAMQGAVQPGQPSGLIGPVLAEPGEAQ